MNKISSNFSIGKLYYIGYKHNINFNASSLQIVTLLDVVQSPIGEYFEVLHDGVIKKLSTGFYALREI